MTILLVILSRQPIRDRGGNVAPGLQVWLAISRICSNVAPCDDDGRDAYPLMAGPSIVLDLRFRVVRPDQEVFLVFPGQNYGLYEYFVTTAHIFPELPALDLVPKMPMAKQPDLDAKMLRSRAIDAWYAHGKKDDMRPR
jgi:hypothetical protein